MTWPPKTLCATLLSLCLAVPSAMALCMDGKAAAVVQARVVKALDLHGDASDPGSITATRYAVRVQRTLRGRAPAAIALHSENTSARFPMDTGERYLLFVSRDASGRYFVDACGHSARLTEARAAMRALAAAPSGR